MCKELIYPKGGTLDIRAVKLGDTTLSVLEIWGAEYQENSAMLIAPESLPVIEKICARERCPFSVLGSIDGSGRVKLVDPTAPADAPVPEDLDLEKVLGDMPKKTYDLKRAAFPNDPVTLPEGTPAADALDRVLRLPGVCSKRFLTTKVDRSVTGLVAQQQCCGPLQVPVADVGVISQTHYGITGGATSVGRATHQGHGGSRRDGAHVPRRVPHQPRLRQHHGSEGHQILRELDVRREAPRRRRAHV